MRTQFLLKLLTPICAIALALLYTAALFWPGIDGPFLLDDHGNIELAQVANLSWSELAYVAQQNSSGPLGRPIPALTFAIDHYLYGDQTRPYKYFNILIHLINVALLFWLGGRLLSVIKRDDLLRPWLIAGLAALLWGIHPLQVSTVLYVVQRMTSLSALFTILALLSYVIGRQRLHSGRRLALPLMIGGVCGWGALSALSKENGALIPLYILLIELIAFRRETTSHREALQLRIFLVIFTIIPVVAGAIYLLTYWPSLMEGYAIRDFTLTERLLTQSKVMLFYFKLILLPRLADMTLYHDYFPISRTLDWEVLLAVSTLAAIAVAGWSFRKRAPVLSLGILWFFVSHLIESTILPLEIAFEHRNYLAMFGLLLPAAYYLVPQRLDKWAKPKLAIIALTAAVFSFLTFIHSTNWSSGLALHKVAAEEHPGSPRVNTYYANQLVALGKIEQAIAQLENGEHYQPDEAGYAISIMLYSCISGRPYDLPYQRAVQKVLEGRITFFTINALDSVVSSVSKGHCKTLEKERFLALIEAAHNNKNPPPLNTSKGNLHLILARAYTLTGYYENATIHFEAAFRFNPKALMVALAEKAHLEMNLGRLDDAAATLTTMREHDTTRFVDEHPAIRSVATRLQELKEENRANSVKRAYNSSSLSTNTLIAHE